MPVLGDFVGLGLVPVGQLAHYIGATTGIHYAALILSGADTNTVDLKVFLPDGTEEIHSAIVYSESWENDTWHWPSDGVTASGF